MLATSSSHPIRAALSAAAVSATALLSALVPWNAGAQEISQASPKLSATQPVLEKQIRQFTRQECSLILTTAAEVFKTIGHHGYNAELPLTLARYIAPTNPDFAHEILVKGGIPPHVRALFTSTVPADIQKANTLRAAITCDGPKEIQARGNGAVLFSTLRITLLRLPERISLEEAGVRGVLPEVVGSLSGPAIPKGEVRIGDPKSTKLRLN